MTSSAVHFQVSVYITSYVEVYHEPWRARRGVRSLEAQEQRKVYMATEVRKLLYITTG